MSQNNDFDRWIHGVSAETLVAKGADLIIDTIEDVEPLDDQFGVHPPKTVPDALYEPFFGQPDPTKAEIAHYGSVGAVPPMKTYAILDAAKVVNLVPILASSGLKHRCLFKGDAYDELRDVAPWIVRLKEGNDFTRQLFTMGDAPWFMWGKNPGIYLRSRAKFKTIWQHFRKFVRLKDDRDSWLFFRFWDAEVFVPYLHGIANRPDRTTRLLQTARHDSIEVILLDDLDTASCFKLAQPVEQRPSGPMVLDEHDLSIMQNIRWQSFARELGRWISTAYPERFSTFSKRQLQTMSRHVITQGRRFGCVNKEDFVYLAHMMMTLGGWFYASGYPAPLIALLQDDQTTTRTRLEEAFLPAYETLPMAQLSRQWKDVTAFIQPIAQEEQITRARFREFTARFLPNHLRAVENLMARMSHHAFFHQLEPKDQGRYLVLALSFGERFEIDPLRPWAELPEIETIDAAWHAAFVL